MTSDANEPLFISDRHALAKLYLACIGRLPPSVRDEWDLTDTVARVGRYLGVPDAE